MTTGKDCEYKCMSHGKQTLNFCAIDYCLHTLDTTIPLLTNPSYFSDRGNIRDHSAKALLPIVRYLYKMLEHIYYHHRKIFDSLQHRYRIDERLTLYCKKFKAIDNPQEYCIKL
jgi:hypothetical protein